jgi:DGQHR domain-containing protein
MSEKKKEAIRGIRAIKVKQWLPEWDKVDWNPKEKRSKPQQCFYQFSISAPELKALSGVYARTTKDRKRGREDLGIQRRHEPERSEEIARFVKYGYPWSALSKAKQESEEYKDLRKPGWLPTAIVVNILKENDVRRGGKVDKSDLLKIADYGDGSALLHLPESYSGKNWKYKTIPPIEIIDGQHRLWAFEGSSINCDFELPVVAFVGLDISWQAYLFYTINIKPKKINASLAFDLYPLLRAEDWLTKFEGHIIYRETRAQELVDLLWSHPESPWHKRINMLGEPGYKGIMVSQSAWVKSLLATYIKSWEGRGIRAGGLYGAPIGSHKEVLPWSRAEQVAFLIVIGQHIRDEIKKCKDKWAEALRAQQMPALFTSREDLAFYGSNSLLNQDQGIRAILHITNDLTYFYSDKLNLTSWGGGSDFKGSDEERVKSAIESLNKEKKIIEFINEISKALASYDWRASGAPGLTDQDSLLKAAFRGSGGYKELRKHLLRHLSTNGSSDVVNASNAVIKALGY